MAYKRLSVDRWVDPPRIKFYRAPLMGDGYNINHLASIFCNFSDLTLDAALEEGDRLNELSLRPEYDRTFSVMSRKALYAPMMETIKPYRDKLIQAKRQLDQAWKGETASVPVVTSSQPDDVHELRENLSRVSIKHWRPVYFCKRVV